jgi:hypothetical protein
MFNATWYVYQGTLDVTSQIELGGKGQYSGGRNATRNWADTKGEGKVSFDNIDGLEVFMSDDGKIYAMIQEDSGNRLGERVFITSALEHEADGNELTYYLVALSGGAENTRMTSGVGIPMGTSCGSGPHEFSGLFDMSGLIYQENGTYAMSASDDGYAKRSADKKVNINDKNIMVGLQAHNMACGAIKGFQTDRGGQWLLYQPDIPV